MLSRSGRRGRTARRIGLRTGKIPVVAVLMETSRSFGRGVIRGITAYAAAHGPWNLSITPGDIEQHVPPLERWHVDAIIGRIASQRTLLEVLGRKVPTVYIDSGVCGRRIPCVKSDQASICSLAFKHLRDCGLGHFAFYGMNTYWGNERRTHFEQCVRAAGLEVRSFKYCGQDKKTLERQLADWLVGLPKPVGLMAQDDLLAHEAINVCRFLGIDVPGQVAIIGVDNDELICNASGPPLSSVALNSEQVGFQAASALDCLLTRKKTDMLVLVDPCGVVPRQSSDTVCVDDSEVATALRFIRSHLREKISVDDLLRQALVSRRVLEMRFEKVLGRSPHEEILRCRMERAKNLLVSTNDKVSAISDAAGFASVQYMHRVFQRELRQTPTQFRAANRPFAR